MLSEKLKKYRADNNLTQEEFAAKLFVTRNAVSKWENDNGYPNIDTLKDIAKLLNVTIDELLGDDDVKTIAINTNEKMLAIEVTPDNKNLSSILLDEKIALLPLLSSIDENYTNDFINELKNNSNNAKIYPIYFEPFNDKKPRKLFDKINVARKSNAQGIILYDLETLTKEYYDALTVSIFNIPNKQKENTVFIKQEQKKEETNHGTTIEN